MITRSGILREVLEEKGRELMKYSKNGGGLIPETGYEKVFEDRSEECRMLRLMIMENSDRENQAMAQWQQDLMDGKQPDMSWPSRTPDELLRRRRHEKAEEFRPQPVTYPGGEE